MHAAFVAQGKTCSVSYKNVVTRKYGILKFIRIKTELYFYIFFNIFPC